MRFSPRHLLSSVPALACGLLLAVAVQAAPDKDVLKLAEQVEPAVIDQLKELVLIESGSQQTEGLARMADVLEQRLQALGMEVERHPATAGAGADILVATIRGSGSAKIMLQGHMDTVYGEGILDEQPYKVDGDRIYGPGIADDKGGLALMLGALQMAQAANWTDFDTLTVLMNPDEEVGSPGSKDLIAKLASEHDVVLSFEPSAAKAVSPNHILLLGAAGVGQARLTVEGKAAHAGNAPEDGRNAFYELAYQTLVTRDIAADIDGAALNWTVAQTDGNPPNQIPASAHAIADVRITQAGADEKLAKALDEHVKGGQVVPDTQATVALDMQRPMFQANDASRALAKKAQGIYQELGRELTLVPMVGGGTDAAFAAQSGKAAVLESFGLAGAGYHARDEYIDADSVVPRLYLVTRLLQEIGSGD